MANDVDWKTLLLRFVAIWRSAHASWTALQLPSQSRLSWLLGLSRLLRTEMQLWLRTRLRSGLLRLRVRGEGAVNKAFLGEHGVQNGNV